MPHFDPAPIKTKEGFVSTVTSVGLYGYATKYVKSTKKDAPKVGLFAHDLFGTKEALAYHKAMVKAIKDRIEKRTKP